MSKTNIANGKLFFNIIRLKAQSQFNLKVCVLLRTIKNPIRAVNAYPAVWA